MGKTKKASSGKNSNADKNEGRAHLLRHTSMSDDNQTPALGRTRLRTRNAASVGSISDGDNEPPRQEKVKNNKHSSENTIGNGIGSGSATGSHEEKENVVVAVKTHNEASTVKNSIPTESMGVIKKQVKRLTSTPSTRHIIPTVRTSKGTPYIRKVRSGNNRTIKMEFSAAKTERISGEMKKINNFESAGKKQSAVKMPNFKNIHEKMFEKMESIDVTVRKRELRKNAASTTKENNGSSIQGNASTATKSKKVVRKLYNPQPQPVPSETTQTNHFNGIKEFPEPVQWKSFGSEIPKRILQERSTNNARVFQFTGNSNPPMELKSLPNQKTAANRVTRRQELYKSRPVSKTRPQHGNLLKGVRLNRRFMLQMGHRENLNHGTNQD